MDPKNVDPLLSSTEPDDRSAVAPMNSAPLRIEVLREIAALDALREEWERLLLSTGASLFAGPDWVLAWLRAFDSPSTHLCTVVAFQDTRLRLVAPLVRQTERLHGMRLPCVHSPTNAHSPRYEWVSDLDPRQAMEAVLRALDSTGSWHVLRLDHLDPASGVLRGISGLGSTVRVALEPGMVSPYLPIRSSWKEFYAGLSSKLRKNNSYALRKLMEGRKVVFETVQTGDDLRALLSEAYAVERSSWKGETKTAIADHPALREFYDEVAHRCSTRNRWWLHALRVDDRMIAFQYCVALGPTYSLVKVGYDPEWARFSPGTLLLEHVLEQVFERTPHKVYDMLGAANEWKLRWDPELRPLCRMSLYRRSPRGRFAYLAEVEIRAWAKRIPGMATLWRRLRERGRA